MITRITGRLERIDGHEGVLVMSGGEVAYQVLLPAYLAEGLLGRTGETLTLWTLEYLESPNQGATFVPRMLGFATREDRKFFELLTTVKGIGNRKAMRAMAVEPAAFAAAVVAKDVRALTKLPEIGKRLAETIILDLSGKVEAFLSAGEVSRLTAGAGEVVVVAGDDPVGADAVEALVALGEPRSEADVLVAKARARAKRDGRELASVEAVLDSVFAGRAR